MVHDSCTCSLLGSHYSFVCAHVAIQVYKIDLGNCTSYNSCESCTRSSNPLCGWCVLEGKCSRSIFCQSASLQHRWVQNANKCISDLQLDRDSRTEESFRDVCCPSSKVMLLQLCSGCWKELMMTSSSL